MIFGISYLHSCCIATLILVLNWIDIVNEAIKTISNQFFFCFFLWKDFERTKAQIKPKPTNKNTNKWTKNNKDSNFLRIKTSKRGKIDYFVLWCFLYAQNLFVKKISWFEIVFIASFTILQTCTPINPPIENSFLRTYFYLWSSVRIFSVYENLFLLWESFGISIICVSMSLSK